MIEFEEKVHAYTCELYNHFCEKIREDDKPFNIAATSTLQLCMNLLVMTLNQRIDDQHEICDYLFKQVKDRLNP